MSFRGAIFDVDGVLVDSPHEQAWREGLQQLMENEWADVRSQTSYAPEKFTPEVYQRVMSGMPRYAGARAVLEYFGVPDPERRAQEYGDRKQVMIVELIEAGQFHAYPDALRFVLAVKDAGLRISAASSSKNANAFLERIRLDEFVAEEGLDYDFVRPGYTLLDTLDANVSGRDFPQRKPGSRRGRPSWWRTQRTACRLRRPGTWPPWASRGQTTRSCWPTPTPTSSSPAWTTSPSRR